MAKVEETGRLHGRCWSKSKLPLSQFHPSVHTVFIPLAFVWKEINKLLQPNPGSQFSWFGNRPCSENIVLDFSNYNLPSAPHSPQWWQPCKHLNTVTLRSSWCDEVGWPTHGLLQLSCWYSLSYCLICCGCIEKTLETETGLVRNQGKSTPLFLSHVFAELVYSLERRTLHTWMFHLLELNDKDKWRDW